MKMFEDNLERMRVFCRRQSNEQMPRIGRWRYRFHAEFAQNFVSAFARKYLGQRALDLSRKLQSPCDWRLRASVHASASADRCHRPHRRFRQLPPAAFFRIFVDASRYQRKGENGASLCKQTAQKKHRFEGPKEFLLDRSEELTDCSFLVKQN